NKDDLYFQRCKGETTGTVVGYIWPTAFDVSSYNGLYVSQGRKSDTFTSTKTAIGEHYFCPKKHNGKRPSCTDCRTLM
ncbi:hypothetical protein O181_119210, partial [Austropuccinia psidii MF-1]|nr:hypothetical protein [Austropuccinia psidii MF-1]